MLNTGKKRSIVTDMKLMKRLIFAYIILCIYATTIECCPQPETKQRNIITRKEPCIPLQRHNLIKTILFGSTSELEKMLNDGINPNFYFEISPDTWVTPLQAALLKRDNAMINILLKSPTVDLKYRLPYEYTNLEFAVLYLSIPLAKLLLQQGMPPVIDSFIMRSLTKAEAPNGKSREMIELLNTYKQYWQAMREFVKVQYCPESPAYNMQQYLLKKIFFEHLLTTR